MSDFIFQEKILKKHPKKQMMSKKIFLDFFTFSKIDNWEQKNLIWYNISSAFISLIVKQFKFYVSCVSLPPGATTPRCKVPS